MSSLVLVIEELKKLRPRAVILNRADGIQMWRYLDRQQPKMIKNFKNFWNDLGKEISSKKWIDKMRDGNIPPELVNLIEKRIKSFVKEKVITQWVSIYTYAFDYTRDKIRKRGKQDSITRDFMNDWISNNGGELVRNLSSQQRRNLLILLNRYIVRQVVSPYELAEIIKNTIGLTENEAKAVSKFRDSLIMQGVSGSNLNSQVKAYAEMLRMARALRIARTELSKAYNWAQLMEIKIARNDGFFSGEVAKSWLVADDERLCDACSSMEGVTVWLDDYFQTPEGRLESPPLHPSCRCTLIYEVIREV